MKLLLKKGITSKLIRVFIQNSSLATGAGLTGLVFNSGSLTAYYIREGDASATAITLATMTVGTWATGGFKEVDATNMPGLYEVGLPNAVLASGSNSVVVMLKGATNMAPVLLEIQLLDVDLQDATRFGLTALPNVAAGANGGLPLGNASGQVVMSGTATGAITSGSFAAGAIDNAAIATDAIGSAELAASAVTEIQSGLATSAALVTAQADLDDIQARLPAALVGGRMDSNTGAMSNDVLTAAALAASAVTEIQSGLSTYAGGDTAGTTTLLSRIPGTVQPQTGDAYARIGAAGAGLTALGDTRIANLDAAVSSRSTYAGGAVASVTGNVGGNVTGSVGSVATGGITSGSFAAGAIDNAAIAADAIGSSELAASAVNEIADQVWDEAIAGHLAGGSTGAALNAAGSSGDPWTTAVPGAYVAGQAGYILGTNLDATISSRSTLDGTGVQSALTSQGYTTARAGYLDVLNGIIAAIWANVTRTLTAGTNIVLAKGTGITGFNDLSAAQVNTEVDTGLSDVGLTTTVTGNMDAAISSRLASASYTTPPTVVQIRSEMDSNSTKLANLDATVSSRSTLTAALVWSYVVEGSFTALNFMRFIAAALAGKLSGAATATVTIRDVSDTKNRIVATVDADGNRSAITLDGS